MNITTNIHLHKEDEIVAYEEAGTSWVKIDERVAIFTNDMPEAELLAHALKVIAEGRASSVFRSER